MKEPVFVSPAEIAASKAAAKRVKDEVYDLGLTYHIESYGCQMNEHDSEKIAGMMEEMYRRAEFAKPPLLFFAEDHCPPPSARRIAPDFCGGRSRRSTALAR